MRFSFIILLISAFIFQLPANAQKSKNKKQPEEKGPKIFEVVGDSVRRDSIVFYETEIGYVMPDLSPKFNGKWSVNVMRRQARAVPDSLQYSYIEFYGDTLFNAYVGCNTLHGKYIIKGPTIKFTVLKADTPLTTCTENIADIESWFIKLMETRVSYFGIDNNTLLLKDVAANNVFDCARRKEDEPKPAANQNN